LHAAPAKRKIHYNFILLLHGQFKITANNWPDSRRLVRKCIPVFFFYEIYEDIQDKKGGKQAEFCRACPARQLLSIAQ